MKCGEIRDIIITEYIDNEIDAKVRGEMELHLSICAGCHEFKEALLSGIVEPLRNAEPAVAPEALWFKVRSAIERLEKEENSFDIGALVSSFMPRWANVAAMAAMVLIMSFAGNFLAHNIWEKQIQQTAQYTAEENETLALAELSDMPNAQVEKVYSNIIGG